MRDGRVDRPGDLVVLLPVAAAAVVWWPVTATYFHHDDFLNLYNLVDWPVGEFVTRMHGGHLLVTRNLVFLAHHWLFGVRSELYLGAMWLTHLLNVALLYLVVRRLTASRALAVFGATLWGVAAVNEGTLDWYSVYGQVLALTAVLLVLLGLLRRAARGDARWWPLLGWAGLLAVASSSFGTGLGMTLAMPLVALLWLPPAAGRRRAVAVLALTAAAMVVLYLALRPADIAAHGGPPVSTQLWNAYGHQAATAMFFAHLFACGATALLLSTWYHPELYPGPVASLALATAAALLLAGLWRAPSAWRYALGAALLAASAYGFIAVGRLYATAKFAFVVHAARYHYAAPALLAIALCAALSGLAGLRWPSIRVRMALLIAWFALEAIGYGRGTPIEQFAAARREVAQTMDAIAAAVEAAPPGADVYLPFQKFRSVGAMAARFPRVFPGNAAVFAIFSPTDTMDGRRVFFIAPNPIVYANTRSGLRSPTLIVAPASGAPAAPATQR